MTIPMFKVFMSSSAAEAVKEVLNSGYIGQGPKVDLFEKQLKEYLSSPVDVLSLNSCTSALELALHLIGVGPGDEVITSALCCTASTGAIIRSGAIPVWADIRPNGLIDPVSIKACMSQKTKSVLAIDWAGWPCDYDALKEITGVPVIEDAAHAFGAKYHGQSIAAEGGDYMCFRGANMVTTSRGRVRFDKLTIKDKVLTEDGSYHNIVKIHMNEYKAKGKWTQIWYGRIENHTRISCTSNHKIKIFRNKSDHWVPANEVLVGDYVYVETKKCGMCESLTPYYYKMCGFCHPNKDVKRRKIQSEKTKARYRALVGHMARVPVVQTKTFKSIKSYNVFNLTVENNPTYFVKGLLVHNCLSFQAIKSLTTGDGGAIICPPDQVERARLLRWFGLDRKSSANFRCSQSIQESGFKMHMNDINAAIGIANLEHANWVVGLHRDNAAFYDRELPEQCLTHSTVDNGSCWIYNIAVPKRDEFEQWVKSRGYFDVSQVHARNDRHPAFSKARSPVPLTALNWFSSHVTAIPVHWAVTKSDRELIVEEVRQWCKLH